MMLDLSCLDVAWIDERYGDVVGSQPFAKGFPVGHHARLAGAIGGGVGQRMERSKRSDDRNASALPRTHHRYCRGNGEGGAFEIGSQQLGHLLHRLWRKFSIPRE